jgi:OmpA-OmpF porin, OOP family
MKTSDPQAVSSLKHQLEICSQQQFSGRLDIEANNDQWCLYFSLGRLVWASGGLHWFRRWHRCLHQHCPQVDRLNIGLGGIDGAKNRDYLLLIQLVKQQHIAGAQATSVIRSTVSEVLFDILQQEHKEQLRFTRDEQDTVDTPLILLNPKHVVDSVQKDWELWSQAGLAEQSPNLALMISQPEQLQQHTSQNFHQTLIAAIDDTKTLRDLALLLKQDPLLLARIVGLYVRKGWIELVEVPDRLSLDPSESSLTQNSSDLGYETLALSTPNKTSEQPLDSESVSPSSSSTKSRSILLRNWAVPALLVLALGGGYAIWRSQSRNALNPVGGVINLPSSPGQITIVGTDFSGHSTFRSPAFQEVLKQAGINLNYQVASDEQSAKLLNQGSADLELTTLDQFLQHQSQGKIVGLIDHSVGGDAVVLNTKRYPGLKSLLDLGQLIQQARSQGQQLDIALPQNTPSEYLVMLLGAKFDGFKLSDFHVKKTANTPEDWKLLHDPSQNLAVTVLREPDIAHARQQGYSVVLSSQDTPEEIIDVLVASNRLLKSQPEQIAKLLEAYYRRVDADARDASPLKHQIVAESKLSPADAAAVMEGIQFFSALETKEWLTGSKLEKRIGSMAAILTLADRINQVPPAPKELFSAEFMNQAANNTETLIRLVRAENPKLADKLAGKSNSSGSAPNIAQIKGAPTIGDLQLQWDIKFDAGSTHLTDAGKQALNRLAQEISEEFNPQTVAVQVIGHTSQTGSAAQNQALSQKRAEVVVEQLKSLGLSHVIVAEGKGSSQPLSNIAPTDLRNQRTEIRLVHLSQ